MLGQRPLGAAGDLVHLLERPLQEIADGVHDVQHDPVGRGRRHGEVEGHVGGRVAVALVEGAGAMSPMAAAMASMSASVRRRAASAAASPSSMRRSS